MRFRFLPPIGTVDERLSGKVWPGMWSDATGYGTYYEIKPGVWNYHTGSDMNLNSPYFDADAHSPIYAIGPGVVIYAQRWPSETGAWGNLIIVDHSPVDGGPCYSRYAHVEAIQVAVGDRVDEWTHIANVGNAFNIFPYHLHVDISLTNVLRGYAGDWPAKREDLVKLNYVNPFDWLQGEHEIEDGTSMPELVITAPNGLLLLDAPPLAPGMKVIADEAVTIGAATYRKVDGGWLLEKDAAGVYLKPPPPPEPIYTGYANVVGGLNVRAQPTTASAIIAVLDYSTSVQYQLTGIIANGYEWVKLVGQAGYVAKKLLRPQ